MPFAPRTYVSYRTPSPLEIDGRLTESTWTAAPWSDDFIDIEGSLNAYNYPTRTLIEAGQLISLNVTTFTSGDMVVTGMGTALVNGSVRNVYLNVTRSSGFLTFGIFDSDASMALLAGGHGESGRATLDFTPNAP